MSSSSLFICAWYIQSIFTKNGSCASLFFSDSIIMIMNYLLINYDGGKICEVKVGKRHVFLFEWYICISHEFYLKLNRNFYYGRRSGFKSILIQLQQLTFDSSAVFPVRVIFEIVFFKRKIM